MRLLFPRPSTTNIEAELSEEIRRNFSVFFSWNIINRLREEKERLRRMLPGTLGVVSFVETNSRVYKIHEEYK